MPVLTALPPFARAALLLDLDGTLLDLAPTPDSVVVPDGLRGDLRALRGRLGDAVAVVTGRPIAQVDALLADAPFAVAGEHGGAIRHAPGDPVARAPLRDPPPEWLEAGRRIAAAHPGALFEPKSRGFVLHYRLAPQAGAPMRAALDALLDGAEGFALMAAHMAWEVKPLGADKGTAVRGLMAAPPFRGRLPIFIGDDVTDEDGMAVAREMGGAGLRVQDAFGAPQAVRDWLAGAARRDDWPAPGDPFPERED
ncbi:MAG: trehalose-phosphatase [Proteobacteria bacterium]|nr:trehalose-phosphatase [Pseudomonadota bacterium]